MLKIENQEDLIKAVEDTVAAKLKKYNQEAEESGTNATKETREEIKALSEKHAEIISDQKDFEIKFAEIEQRLIDGQAKSNDAPQSIGELIVKDKNVATFLLGKSASARMEVKNTILTESGSPQNPDNHVVHEDRLNGIVPKAMRSLNLLDIIPTGQTSSDTIKYSTENSFTNAAAETAQGSSRPESAQTMSSVTEYVRSIETFIKVHKHALADAPFLQSFINARLGHNIKHKLQIQILTGNGTEPNLKGLTASGRHTAFTPTTGEIALDSINRAKYAIVGADWSPNVVLMNPSNFGAAERVKAASSSNSYASGEGNAITYINNGLNPLVWGMPVILSNDVTAGKFFCMDINAIQLFMRSALEINMWMQDDTNVRSGLVTITGEMRAALAVYQSGAIQYGDLTI